MKRESIQHRGRGGKFREIFPVGRDEKQVAKIPRPSVPKQTPIGKINVPGAAYALFKFGRTNVNKVDYENYHALPKEIRDAFTPKSRLIKGVLVQERVLDYDGSPSLSLDEHRARNQIITNVHFWREVERLKDILIANQTYLMGVFSNGLNVMVQKTSPHEWKPVIVDFKRLGNRSYPLQPQLAKESRLQEKFLGHYERFLKMLKPAQMDETLPSHKENRVA